MFEGLHRGESLMMLVVMTRPKLRKVVTFVNNLPQATLFGLGALAFGKALGLKMLRLTAIQMGILPNRRMTRGNALTANPLTQARLPVYLNLLPKLEWTLNRKTWLLFRKLK